MTTDDSTIENPAQAVPDRRGRIESTINSLINERQQVLVSYGKLAGLKSYEDIEEGEEQAQSRVRAAEVRLFLQLLMDYTALGHFEIYQRIIEGNERRTSVKDASKRVYPGIAKTTDYLIDFNDKYDRFASTPEELVSFEADISELGEILAERGELEDQILAALQR